MTERVEWPIDVRADAMRLAVEVNAEAASDQTGVPAGTIRKWLERSLDLVRPHLPEHLQAVRSWHEALPLLLDAVGIVGAKTIIRLDEALDRNDHRAARDYAVVFGILSEKGQLLSGGVTSRTESLTAHRNIDAEIAEAEAEYRRLHGVDL